METSNSHFDYIHMLREQQRQQMLSNPQVPPVVQNSAPPQAPVAVVAAQHPVAVGQETQQNSSSGWKTAALWVAGVATSTIIAYLVTKALVKTEEHIKKNGWMPNPMPGTPDPVVPSTEPKNLADALAKTQAQVNDIHEWIASQGKAA